MIAKFRCVLAPLRAAVVGRTALFLAALLAATAAGAADNVLLIQLRPAGFTVWHTEGESQLTDDEVMTLEASAKPGGGEEVPTSFGPARAYESGDSVTIRLPDARTDKDLLLDRDNCGHVRVWHGAGTTTLSDDQITDIFMSALPEGGKRLAIGGYHVKAFITPYGVTATLWLIPPRK
ncbi:MAG: hypothetical protein U1A72_08420 [Sulfuritalea sp.]|nr:hypothetical protein [Sulfuritalea sp.]